MLDVFTVIVYSHEHNNIVSSLCGWTRYRPKTGWFSFRCLRVCFAFLLSTGSLFVFFWEDYFLFLVNLVVWTSAVDYPETRVISWSRDLLCLVRRSILLIHSLALCDGKVRWICIAPCREHTSKALRYGTRFQEISQFYLLTTRLSANRMNHTCLCLHSRSWYSFIDPGGMEGWVGLGWVAGWLHTEISVRHRELNPDTVAHLSTTGPDID